MAPSSGERKSQSGILKRRGQRQRLDLREPRIRAFTVNEIHSENDECENPRREDA
jgi:hypothetical protein